MHPQAPTIHHLLFADDCILFCKAKNVEVIASTHVLDTYCAVSGQCINGDNSTIFFGKGCPEVVRQEIKVVMQVHNESLNDKYLGFPTDMG